MRGTRRGRGRAATISERPGTRRGPSAIVCAMQQDDEVGYRLALVLFTVAIPIIGLIGAYLASQMPA